VAPTGSAVLRGAVSRRSASLASSAARRGARSQRLPLCWPAAAMRSARSWKADRLEAKPSNPLVASYQSGRQNSVFSRYTLRKRFRTTCRPLGANRLESVNIHHGRHTFISHAFAGGCTLAEVREAVGHTNVSIMSGYLHIVTDDEGRLEICLRDDLVRHL
jgi:integrase